MRKSIFWSLTIIWLSLNIFSFFVQAYQTEQFAGDLAANQGKMFFDHIVSMRSWNANHGGVYVPVTDTTPSNPYLKIPNRDITGINGLQLTLINPAYMTRQLSEVERDKSGIQFHITSLNPIRPENKADQWETKALQSFELGNLMAYNKIHKKGVSFYRYMEPLIAEKNCLKCHEQQGYKLGDIRGGISVSIPAELIAINIDKRIQNLMIIHGIICGIGVILLLLFQLIGQRISKKLEKSEKKARLADIDPLTNLPNRRYYENFLKKEWRNASRHHYPLSMIMIDIDFFKPYNDNLGHPQGDECLKQISSILSKFFQRSDDMVARYGGEEFCVIAACDAIQVYLLADNIRKEIKNAQIQHPESNVSDVVTISAGVATLIPSINNRPEELLDNADSALYLAKENGRNRVEKFKSQNI